MWIITYHVLQGLLLLVMSLHVSSMAGGHVLLQLVQVTQLLSTGAAQLLDKVIACLHQKMMNYDIDATRVLLTVQEAFRLGHMGEHQQPEGSKRR